VIAGLESVDACADRLDDARAVRHRNAPGLGGQHAADDAIVMEVQRARVNANPKLARAGLSRIADIDDLETIDAGG